MAGSGGHTRGHTRKTRHAEPAPDAERSDGSAGGVGANLTPDVGDQVLAPDESMTVDFIIGLQQRRRFTFFVNLLGEPTP